MRGVSGRCSGWLVDVCFFCLLSFYRLVFSFSAVRCSKAERKRKENGRQTGTLGDGGCTFWVLRLVVIVLFSSVQFSVSSSRRRHQGSISGVWKLWTAGCDCVGWGDAWCRCVCASVYVCVWLSVCVCGEPWCRRVRGGGGGVGGSLWEAEASVFFLEDLHGILAGLHLQQRPRSCCLCFARGEVATFSPWETRETQQGGRKRRKRQSAEWVTV